MWKQLAVVLPSSVTNLSQISSASPSQIEIRGVHLLTEQETFRLISTFNGTRK